MISRFLSCNSQDIESGVCHGQNTHHELRLTCGSPDSDMAQKSSLLGAASVLHRLAEKKVIFQGNETPEVAINIITLKLVLDI